MVPRLFVLADYIPLPAVAGVLSQARAIDGDDWTALLLCDGGVAEPLAGAIGTAVEICNRFIPAQPRRVVLVQLQPGDELRHGDPEIMHLHVPLQTNHGAGVTPWRSREGRHMPFRSLCLVDARRPYVLANRGNQPIIHLVIDALPNDDLRAMFRPMAAAIA
jgi:hypothetical protein